MFQDLIVAEDSTHSDAKLDAYAISINSKEELGLIMHLPRPRHRLFKAELVFSEIVRELVIDRCMFTLIDSAVRNYIID